MRETAINISRSSRILGATLAVVGGLLFSQLVTLYVTPVFYVYLDSFQSWLRRSRRGARMETISTPQDRILS